MPRIFDNIERSLLPALRETLGLSDRADYCVGYFNLRGWRQVDDLIERWSGEGDQCCRLLVGMHQSPQEQLRVSKALSRDGNEIDQGTAVALKKKLALEFREQLTIGVPTNADEAGLRRLAVQLESQKLKVKLYLRHPLHAKLYLHFRKDPVSPIVAYLGSSNLTMAGLANQGELNVDVVEHDAGQKLASWFEARWDDRFCLDISKELIDVLRTSWARPESPPPYHVYVKMAYHLSQDARAGLAQFQIPSDFGNRLLDFQVAAVKIAAQRLNKHQGVILGDVVGLGKTLMASALARIFEDDHGAQTLIICPKNLVPMWEGYVHRYRMRAHIVSITRVQSSLAQLRRYKLVLIDESHNLRNREGSRYRAIAEYIAANESYVILLSATPYNKSYLDLSSQLRLFVDETKDIGIRPENLIREIGQTTFLSRHQCPERSLAAFEKSQHIDDWRELMRLYLVRRTRGFIQDNYATLDPTTNRKYLQFSDGQRSYFPNREPRTVKFAVDESDPADPYARLFADDVVRAVDHLLLPRYGLGNYVKPTPTKPPTTDEAKALGNLSRAGNRLKGFCRINLFKRLESGGWAFTLSVQRHILRNFIYLHAIESDSPIPIGTQDLVVLDAPTDDEDDLFRGAEDDGDARDPSQTSDGLTTEAQYRARAGDIYKVYREHHKTRFKWLRPSLFTDDLAKHLLADAKTLMKVLKSAGPWTPDRDAKLLALHELLAKRHGADKVLVFSQFADTIDYLHRELKRLGVSGLAAVTGADENPADVARRFSPVSNEARDDVSPQDEVRVVLTTDVLSEGHNLQDCAVIVNFDLPWAIIRLIQRAGRVDRIGQKADAILCYSFLPADGVERIIRLRGRVRQRLKENAEVVGTDESFFDDDGNDQPLLNLYHEKAGVLDDDGDSEVDLASYAFQIWKNAVERDPSLKRIIDDMPNVVYSTRAHNPSPTRPEGVLVYLRGADGTDSLAWVDGEGKSVTESQYTILRAAECAPETPAIPRLENHHELVETGARHIAASEKLVGGQLGRPSSARHRTYVRLKAHAEALQGSLFQNAELNRAIEDVYRQPLLPSAVETLNRQLKSGVDDVKLAEIVVDLRRDGRLVRAEDESETGEARVICSMGLRAFQ